MDAAAQNVRGAAAPRWLRFFHMGNPGKFMEILEPAMEVCWENH
jgi:hypothetical protein